MSLHDEERDTRGPRRWAIVIQPSGFASFLSFVFLFSYSLILHVRSCSRSFGLVLPFLHLSFRSVLLRGRPGVHEAGAARRAYGLWVGNGNAWQAGRGRDGVDVEGDDEEAEDKDRCVPSS
ncbi:hypothetical protein C8R45DRAFT_1101861 [Mycena sanguinolenta]|nr:hypothetical protein C8R45DRAFT_1101861 [Mycena sanguinolenta]